ncbi:hypothetical protein [Microcoleus sp. D3_18_C4]|uniref:hypothetical protein n=1 Tax=Microcoleus sp. D3_18_C4 TaxID=3055335 RepID=UPI002FD54E5F
MTATLDKPQDQRLIHSGIDWQQFKLIEQGFSDSPGLRLFYFKGEVGILAVSQEHEVFSGVIALLLGTYFVEKEIAFTPTGSSSHRKFYPGKRRKSLRISRPILLNWHSIGRHGRPLDRSCIY